jgi:asparagine synthase (glutamine-hydrolysing)
MCGISISLTPGTIEKISHRGIEAKQIQFGKWILGHTRLPIQTLENDIWGQPIELPGIGYLLYNGEIFNYDKKHFENDVHYLTSLFSNFESFTEDLLFAMNQWDGFWSIVLVTEKEIFAFTDPLGKKQLYFNKNREICSEMKPLFPPGQPINRKTISTISKWGYHTGEETCFDEIRRILPGKIYQFKESEEWISTLDYFDWGKVPVDHDLFDLMVGSVSDRLISKKFPIGLLVSGGLDSTIILGILKELGYSPNCYYIKNEEDEFVDLIQDFYNLYMNRIELPSSAQELEEAIWYNESPIDLGSMVLQHKIFSVIPEKIVLSGDGADELFRGYRRNFEYDSQLSDIFDELTYYHLPRLDRASMRYTIELRNPFLSHKIVAFALKYGEKNPTISKQILKDVFGHIIPKKIRDREKTPLKSPEIKSDPMKDRLQIINKFKKVFL